MLVAATPIDPPEGDKCWAFHFVNDGAERIASVTLEGVEYERGDAGNARRLKARFAPIAPGTSVELVRETDTEVRTAVRLRVHEKRFERRIRAEVGRLYRTPGLLVPIPVLGCAGKLATLEPAPSPPDTIEIDDDGVRRWLLDGTCETARWDSLVAVEIVTTDEGPMVDDAFWSLHDPEGGCTVPSEAPEAKALLKRLQRLPGFDNEAVIAAMGCVSNARFLVWGCG